jgi:hypothetical protein
VTSRDGGASVFGAGADRSASLAPSGALVEPHPPGGSKMPRRIDDRTRLRKPTLAFERIAETRGGRVPRAVVQSPIVFIFD